MQTNFHNLVGTTAAAVPSLAAVDQEDLGRELQRLTPELASAATMKHGPQEASVLGPSATCPFYGCVADGETDDPADIPHLSMLLPQVVLIW